VQIREKRAELPKHRRISTHPSTQSTGLTKGPLLFSNKLGAVLSAANSDEFIISTRAEKAKLLKFRPCYANYGFANVIFIQTTVSATAFSLSITDRPSRAIAQGGWQRY
jgi:hypothetical protein